MLVPAPTLNIHGNQDRIPRLSPDFRRIARNSAIREIYQLFRIGYGLSGFQAERIAPNAHAQMPLYQYTEWDRDGVPLATLRRGAVSRAGNYLPMMLDVDLASGTTRRWLFPGQPPLHFKGNSADDMWAGDCADPGFLWFSGRNAEAQRAQQADPEACPAIPENHDFHWDASGSWIGVFK